jgi:hypothetical protein
MSYDPSYRTPPRQDRWPTATPQEPWPAYTGADTYRETAGYRGRRELAGGYQDGAYQDGAYQDSAYQDSAYQDRGYQDGGAGGYWNGNGYDRDNGYDRSYGYGGVAADYGDAWDGGYGGYGQQGDQDGYVGAPDDFDVPEEYLEPAPTGALLIAPDTLRGLPLRSQARDRNQPRGGLLVGALTGFLSAAVAIGVATLAAAFVRPQASPVIAVGGAFIDRTPSAVKNFAVEHFGENDKTMLLLGMYVGIGVLAMVIGCLARRNAAIGIGGIALFGLFGAFVAITRPESRPTDVVPSVIGGLAGIAAFALLAWAASPVAPAALAPIRHARAGGHRRAW